MNIIRCTNDMQKCIISVACRLLYCIRLQNIYLKMIVRARRLYMFKLKENKRAFKTLKLGHTTRFQSGVCSIIACIFETIPSSVAYLLWRRCIDNFSMVIRNDFKFRIHLRTNVEIMTTLLRPMNEIIMYSIISFSVGFVQSKRARHVSVLWSAFYVRNVVNYARGVSVL